MFTLLSACEGNVAMEGLKFAVKCYCELSYYGFCGLIMLFIANIYDTLTWELYSGQEGDAYFLKVKWILSLITCLPHGSQNICCWVLLWLWQLVLQRHLLLHCTFTLHSDRWYKKCDWNWMICLFISSNNCFVVISSAVFCGLCGIGLNSFTGPFITLVTSLYMCHLPLTAFVL